MKKMPSIETIERKNSACGIGELPNALEAWLRFAPRETHETSNAGRATSTAATKTSVIIFGGLVGSDLKM